MANLRVVYDNAVDRATVSTSSTAGSLGANNMKSDFKSEVWRSTSKTANTITLTWPAAEIVAMVALVFCNLTATATIQVHGYAEPGDSVALFDTGAVLACPSAFGGWEWGMLPLGVNGYTSGGATYGVCWFQARPVKKLVITVNDSDNTNNFIEVSRLVSGAYWTPENNAEVGAEVGISDSTTNERSDAGDLRSNRGMLAKTVAVDLNVMTAADRNALWGIFRGNGMYTPVFFSLCPEDSDPSEEQLYQVFGKVAKQTAIRYQFVNQFSSKLELEEI